ncbi:hypothetical protein CEXT_657941 [Caerostris extrusa]|uniref:Uncharacterized protein n=1 Tax=Caerostris extrusa TaxID=172846 RepID=A0AAV4VUM9_CAEEX|nr:hypothetical protein CEXT_657941 [Caerostris extrusa]
MKLMNDSAISSVVKGDLSTTEIYQALRSIAVTIIIRYDICLLFFMFQEGVKRCKKKTEEASSLLHETDCMG